MLLVCWKNAVTESVFSNAYLVIPIASLLSVKLSLYSVKIFAGYNALAYIIIFLIIFLVSLLAGSLLYAYFAGKAGTYLNKGYSYDRWMKALCIAMIVLAGVYILSPKLNNFLTIVQ